MKMQQVNKWDMLTRPSRLVPCTVLQRVEQQQLDRPAVPYLCCKAMTGQEEMFG